MSDESRILAGVLLLSLVTVETGGLYLVHLWKNSEGVTAFQIGFARAGHAHAGVLLILGLLCQVFADQSEQSGFLDLLSRSGVPAAALLMPGGFFAASAGKGLEKPNRFIWMVFAGGVVLAAGLTSLGIGLLTAG